MASTWIKWVKGLTKRREIVVAAGNSEKSALEIAVRWMLFMEWCDDNISEKDRVKSTDDALCPFLTEAALDDIVGMPGFTRLMSSDAVGWLKPRNAAILIVNHFHHNGESAKSRGLDARRKMSTRQMSGSQPDTKPDKPPDIYKDKRPADDRTREEKKRRQQQAEYYGNPGDAGVSGGVSLPAAANSPIADADADSLRAALVAHGVNEPALSKLCAIEGMTPKLVQHFAAQAKARATENPTGLLIKLIEDDAARLIAARRDADQRAAKSKTDAEAKTAEQAKRDADLQRRLMTLPTDFNELDRLKAKYLERYPNAPAAMRNAFPHRSHALRIQLLPFWEEEQKANAGATTAVAGGVA